MRGKRQALYGGGKVRLQWESRRKGKGQPVRGKQGERVRVRLRK